MQAISVCDGRRQDVPAPFPCQLDLSLPSAKRLVRVGPGRFAMMATDAILKIRMRHFVCDRGMARVTHTVASG